jgi:ATP-dependent RNA helicase DeaD
VMEVALAAVNLAHAAIGGPEDGEDIPDVAVSAPPKERARNGRPNRNQRATGGAGPGTTRLYVSLGREAGLRPQDLVGAITGETSLSGRNIGSIEISGRFSLVDVPEDAADEVIKSLRDTKIRGRRATVRRERF